MEVKRIYSKDYIDVLYFEVECFDRGIAFGWNGGPDRDEMLQIVQAAYDRWLDLDSNPELHDICCEEYLLYALKEKGLDDIDYAYISDDGDAARGPYIDRREIFGRMVRAYEQAGNVSVDLNSLSAILWGCETLSFEEAVRRHEEECRRQFVVKTPVGDLVTEAKHQMVDCAEDYPGVYVSLGDWRNGGRVLACVEFNSYGGDLMAEVYADLSNDEPTDIIIIPTAERS